MGGEKAGVSEYIVEVPDEQAELFIARFGFDGTRLIGYRITGELVRCRDCKHNVRGACGVFDLCDIPGADNGFCAWGERR